MKRFPLVLLLICLTNVAARADIVTLEYEAEAATVVGQPFGIDVPRLTIVRGLISYDSDTPDRRPNDPMRGSFDISDSWRFRAEFLGHAITGSNMASASTNLFGHSMGFDDEGDMAFDDVPRDDIGLLFGIAGDEGDLLDDQLPEVFRFRRRSPFNFAPHTFSLRDDSGRMLLQFRLIKQRPIPPVVISMAHSPTGMTLKWCSQFEQVYAIEFSTDFKTWVVIFPGIVGQLIDTTITDVFADRFGEGIPPPTAAYYRIREIPPEAEP